MKMLTAQSTLQDFTGLYGHAWEPGLLTDHVGLAETAGIVVRTGASGATWAYPAGGGVAVRVVCSEPTDIYTEDGPVGGRCGRPSVDGTPFCAGHLPSIPLDEVCEHSMAAWLCAGPDHYPADREGF